MSVERELAALGDPDWVVRVHAARALVLRSSGEDGPRRGRVAPLLNTATAAQPQAGWFPAPRPQDPARFEPGDPRAVAPLLAAATDRTKNVRTAVARALAVVCATAVDREPCEQLRRALEHEVWRVRFAAVRAYALLHEEPGDPLLQLLDDEQESVRWAAVRTIAGRRTGGYGHFGDLGFRLRGSPEPDATMNDGLVLAMGDEAPTVRRAAVWGLRASDDERSRQTVAHALREDGDSFVRTWAAAALGNSSDAVPLLAAALDDPAPWVRITAIRALARLEAVAALDQLVARLADRNRRVRREAVTALARIGDERAVEPLLALYGRGSLRDDVAKALAQLGITSL